MPVDVSLMLSAQRAFLGRIHPEIRMIKVKVIDKRLELCSILDSHISDRARDDISEAITEIIADFPVVDDFIERLEISSDALPKENVIEEGWIYQRAE
ncbi:MAG: hypothetical protein PW843_27700 [Azospirillaceae bacterium]|nr:hypothetical protein [Azospirillaceae bacterium]